MPQKDLLHRGGVLDVARVRAVGLAPTAAQRVVQHHEGEAIEGLRQDLVQTLQHLGVSDTVAEDPAGLADVHPDETNPAVHMHPRPVSGAGVVTEVLLDGPTRFVRGHVHVMVAGDQNAGLVLEHGPQKLLRGGPLAVRRHGREIARAGQNVRFLLSNGLHQGLLHLTLEMSDPAGKVEIGRSQHALEGVQLRPLGGLLDMDVGDMGDAHQRRISQRLWKGAKRVRTHTLRNQVSLLGPG